MERPSPTDSEHALRRAQQRGVSAAHIDATLRWGHVYRQPQGREAYFLGARQVELAAANGDDVSPFEGTAVVVGPDGGMITVVRTHRPARLRRRSK